MNAGEHGDELAALVLSEIDGQSDETARQIVFSRVLHALQGHQLYRPPKAQATAVEPMSDIRAKAFEHSIVPKWAYKGQKVADVPIDYFCHITDPDPWLLEVRAYLSSKRGRARLEKANAEPV